LIDYERVFAQLQADVADTRFVVAIRGPVGDSRNERLWNGGFWRILLI
jgi:hypothetical protein